MIRASARVLALGVCAAFAGMAAAQEPFINVASTTSTEQSGLFTHLLPEFQKDTGIAVRVVAVGTGQALDIGKRGDADVVFVHDKAAEEKFKKITAAYGIIGDEEKRGRYDRGEIDASGQETPQQRYYREYAGGDGGARYRSTAGFEDLGGFSARAGFASDEQWFEIAGSGVNGALLDSSAASLRSSPDGCLPNSAWLAAGAPINSPRSGTRFK